MIPADLLGVRPVPTPHDMEQLGRSLGAVLEPSSGALAAVSDTPWLGIPFFGLTYLLAGLLQASLTVLPATMAAARPSGAVA